MSVSGDDPVPVPSCRYYFRNWHGMNEKEPAVYRNAPRPSETPDERLQGGAVLDKASFEYLFEQVRAEGGFWTGQILVEPGSGPPKGSTRSSAAVSPTLGALWKGQTQLGACQGHQRFFFLSSWAEGILLQH